MNLKKWNRTMRVYDEYEKRFAKARLMKPLRSPWDEKTREDIIEETKKMLGYDEKYIPSVHDMQEISKEDFGKYEVSQLKYSTWDNFIGCASLFVPKSKGKHPLIFVLCGHGNAGRLYGSYVAMAQRLAELGFAVMLPDNIGQGDRESQGHKNAIIPLFCGLTLQGLIVMETIALIRYMKNDPRFDSEKFGSCGNSGGGTLNMFLAALAPEISALSSSGYPSEFHYIFSKERYHCSCNLLPGAACGPEMWEIFSTFAPKPLLLESGLNDRLIPADYAHRNARKVENTYVQLGASDKFRYVSCETEHSWEAADRYEIAKFFSEVFKKEAPSENESPEIDTASWHVEIDESTLTTNRLAQKLTDISVKEDARLSELFKPTSRNRVLNEKSIVSDIGRGEVMRILAQMECALTKNK